jgi:hypothetical protein
MTASQSASGAIMGGSDVMVIVVEYILSFLAAVRVFFRSRRDTCV